MLIMIYMLVLQTFQKMKVLLKYLHTRVIYKNLDDFEVIPLTAYYFDAIRLFLNPESFISLEAFDNFVNLINLLWYACNKDNVKIINSF